MTPPNWSTLALFAPLLLAALPSAAAGSADDPEVEDAAGDASPFFANSYGDILAAWLVPTDEGVEVHLSMAAFDVPSATTAYFLVFENGRETRFAAFATRDDVTEGPMFARGVWDESMQFAGDTKPAEGSLKGTRPVEATVLLPVSDFGESGRATDLRVLVVDYKPNAVGLAPVVLDAAEGGRDFALPPTLAPGDVATLDAGGEIDAPPGRRETPGAPVLILVFALACLALVGRKRCQ